MREILLRGVPISKVNGILFDKDGTLINSENHLLAIAHSRINEAINLFKWENYSPQIISKLYNLLTQAYGITRERVFPNGAIAIASKKDNLISTATIFCIIGKTWPDSLKIANNVFEIANNKASTVKSNEKEKLMPGIHHLLRKCLKKKIKTSIISNDTRNGIKEFLQKNKIENHFPFFWGSDDHPAKPSPDSVKGLCRLMNVKASECALIGDADTDMRMAHDSGIALALAYNAGWEEPPLLYEHHHLINHWDELSFK